MADGESHKLEVSGSNPLSATNKRVDCGKGRPAVFQTDNAEFDSPYPLQEFAICQCMKQLFVHRKVKKRNVYMPMTFKKLKNFLNSYMADHVMFHTYRMLYLVKFFGV